MIYVTHNSYNRSSFNKIGAVLFLLNFCYYVCTVLFFFFHGKFVFIS